jgi:hypothetical protein
MTPSQFRMCITVLFGVFLLIIVIIFFYFYIYLNYQNRNLVINNNKIEKSNHSKWGLIKRWFPFRRSENRDRRVLNDPLYPPENRTDSLNYDIMSQAVNNRNFYVPTNDYGDSFRMVGYLHNKGGVSAESDSGGNIWKLMGKQISNNRSQFYIIPSNNNYDLKIGLNDDIVVGRNKFRDIYDIPQEVTFNTPLLATTPYTFTELPRSDYTNTGYY